MAENNAPSIAELQRAWQEQTYAHIDQKYDEEHVPGYIGVVNSTTGLWELKPPTRAGNYAYVTLQKNSPTAPVEALCPGVIPKAGTPVFVVYKKTGYEIEPNNSAMQSFSPGVNLAVGKHTHQLGFGNEDFVEGLRFKPILAHIKSGGNSLFVTVDEGYYRYSNALVFFPESNIDLTSHLPITASTQCWVLVGIDQTTNALTAVAGAAQSVVTPLAPAQIADISVGVNVLPIAAVKLKNAQSAIQDFRSFYDVRPFASGMNAPSGGGGSNEGIYLALAGL